VDGSQHLIPTDVGNTRGAHCFASAEFTSELGRLSYFDFGGQANLRTLALRASSPPNSFPAELSAEAALETLGKNQASSARKRGCSFNA